MVFVRVLIFISVLVGFLEARPLAMSWESELGAFYFEIDKENKYFEKKCSIREISDRYEVLPLLAPPRHLLAANPQKIANVQALKELLEGKRVLFYTGAGISCASGLPTLCELEQALIEEGKQEEVLQNFYLLCHEALPTPAHKALNRWIETKKGLLLTENLDLLHERAGSSPYRIEKENRELETWLKVDLVVCLGMSKDNKGFLARFKQEHPEKKIIAINLEKPPYLGDEDGWLEADVQQALPAMAAYLEPRDN